MLYLFLSLREDSISFLVENISYKDGLDKGQKWSGPNRSRRYSEEVARIYGRIIQKNLHDPDNHDDVITNLEPDTWNVKSSGP